ncbi:hypothetical protein AbraCBS73388_005230 [Aspergillus brasiliensis]|uniref:tRNA(Ile)-lysidine synthetase n=1 Tax=Aspergillus brasiliensis TaxID=319629 RepID=A0A9W5YME7_9EURO|nr:hypothetical protein AbraCBS73388_005230 [Aspergillus brasiliensis]
MALAYLCKQWERMQTQSSDDTVSVTAFVVDHKAREESTREANMVAGWLDDMGLQTQILPLTWPDDHISAFETHARRLRFQALGQACRARNIETLLMGHHQDDNVETTLWRLCTGARGAGLAGIPAVTRIPECHGLYGVAESGSYITLKPGRSHNYRIKTTNSNELKLIESPHNTTHQHKQQDAKIATGGISITRPLLGFPKRNLLATCEANNIPYVSDPTNFDPTLTPRNAIRSLLAAKKLPRALREESILSLMRKSNLLLRSVADSSNEILDRCSLLSFAPDTGSMIVRFPSSPQSENTKSTETKHGNKNDIDTTSLTLRRITELITPFPENHFPLRSFEPFVSRTTQEYLSSNPPTLHAEPPPHSAPHCAYMPIYIYIYIIIIIIIIIISIIRMAPLGQQILVPGYRHIKYTTTLIIFIIFIIFIIRGSRTYVGIGDDPAATKVRFEGYSGGSRVKGGDADADGSVGTGCAGGNPVYLAVVGNGSGWREGGSSGVADYRDVGAWFRKDSRVNVVSYPLGVDV